MNNLETIGKNRKPQQINESDRKAPNGNFIIEK